MSRRSRTSLALPGRMIKLCFPAGRASAHAEPRPRKPLKAAASRPRSRAFPWLRRRDVLPELDAVAVRVDDLEQTHLAVELEHDADVDALLAQAFSLCLDVVDLYVRDAAVL